MADLRLPTLADMLQAQPGFAPEEDVQASAAAGRQLLANMSAPAAPKRNLFAAGLSAGIDELQGLGGAAVSAVGKAIGAEGLANWGAEVARRNEEESVANGRPDLETAPWKEGGASVLPWLAYQATKQVPQLAAYFAGAAAMPEVAVPAGLARIGMAVPAILGGGRGVAAKVAQEAVAKGVPEAVAGFTGKRAGLEAGKEYAREFLGAAAVGAPLGAGSMYQEALDRGDASQGEALAALGLSPLYGALEAVQPAQLSGILKKGMTGNLGKRLLTGAAVGAAGEVPTEATQTAMEQAFRPDVPLADKAQAVIDAALTGAAVGGIFGGAAGGIGKAKPATAVTPAQAPITTQSPNEDIAKSVDAEVRQITYQPQQAAPMFVDAQGVATQSLYEAQQAQAAAADVQQMQAAQEAQAQAEALRQEQIRAISPQPAAQLALPAPPVAPTAVQEQLNALSDDQITSQLKTYEKRVKSNDMTAADEQTMRYLRAEQDRRAGKVEGATQVAEQPSMFAEADLSGAQQPVATTKPAPVVTPEMETMRTEARNIIGAKDTVFTKNLTATDVPSLVMAAQDYARENQTNDGGASLLLERLNVDNPVKLNKDITSLEKKLADLRVKALTNRATQNQIETVEGQLDKLNQSKSLLDAVEQLRSASSPATAQQGALSDEVSPPASQAGLSLFPELAVARRKGQQGDFGFEGMPKSQVFQQLNTVAQNQRVPVAIRRMAGSAAKAVRSGSLDAQAQAIQAFRAIQALAPEQYNLAQPEVPQQVPPQAAAPQIDVETLRALAGVRSAAQPTVETAQPQLFEQAPQTQPAQPAETGPTTRLYYLRTDSVAGGTPVQIFTTSSERANKSKSTQYVDVPQSKLIAFAGGTARRPDEFRTTDTTIINQLQARPQEKARGTKTERQKAQKVEEKPEPAQQQTATGGATPPSEPPQAPPPPSQGPGPSGPQGDNTKATMNVVTQALDRFLGADLGAKRLKAALYWASRRLIVDRFDRFFGGQLSRFVETQKKVDAARTVQEKRLTGTFDKVGTLFRNNPQAHQNLAKLMSLTSLGFNLSKTWREHTWLNTAPNAEELRAEYDEARQTYQKLKKDGWADPKTKTINAIDIYNEMIANNQADIYAQNAIMNYKKLSLDPTFAGKPGFEQNPMDGLISKSPLEQETPAVVRDYWKSVFDNQTQTAQAIVDVDKNNTTAKTLIRENQSLSNVLEQGTYFHLGREGDQIVSFKFTAKDPQQFAKIVDQFRSKLNDAGLDKFEISKMADKPNVFLRLETVGQRENVVEILKDFVQQGYVADGFKVGSNSEKEFTSDIDVLSAANKLLGEIKKSAESQIARTADEELQKFILQRMQASDVSIRKAMLELAPSNSLMTVLARRKAVSGYSSDMFQNAAFRNKLTADALANIAFYDDIARAYTDIALTTQQAGVAQNGEIDNKLLNIRESVRDELGKRLYQDTDYSKSVLEYLRPVGYVYYLSSPASAALQMASVPTYVWPRLGAKYGFVKSAKALAKTIKMTTKIMNAAVKHGMDAGFFRALDIFFDSKALKDAGVKPEIAEYLLHVANTTSIDFGTMSRELGRLASSKNNTPFDRALAMAGFMNNYVEIMTRVWTALAVHELAPETSDRVSTAADVIDSTIFSFGAGNEPRAYGKQGILKQYTPVAAQFTKINWFMIEELYRSAADAFFGTAQNEEQKKEARRFLAGHATAVAALTGTLGLPFAASVATAINALVGLFGDDDEPYDVQSAWRNWLAGAFGKDAGEIVARGLPRALGFDISERAGEGNLLPFSRFLADKRKFEDKFQDFVTSLAGAPIGAVSSMGLGLSQIANGDVLQGMQSFLPAALRAPTQAYVMGSKGYTDKSGNVIPLDPGALDILYQAIGFKPSEKAEYDEARMAQLSRESVLTRKAGDLRRKLATAIEDGDTSAQRKLFGQAKEFDTSNPAYAVIPSLESTIKQRAKARALTESLGVSFGTNMRDLGSIQLQGFANMGQ